MIKKRVLRGLGVFLLALIICLGTQRLPIHKAEHKMFKKQEPVIEEVPEKNMDVWLTYWDIEEAQKEMSLMEDYIDDVCYFAAYFDEDGNPFIENATVNLHKHYLKDPMYYNKTTYLTFVNDLKKNDGSSVSKDTLMLKDFFKSEWSMDNHIKKLIDMTLENRFDGIEIDYEAMNSDEELWKLYVTFVDRLYQSANANNLELRIVLEPYFSVEDYDWPSGPEYVVMCYNLHGKTTGAGDRANKEFLLQMVDKMKKMPGKVNYALATGGYDFAENGTVVGLTKKEADKLFGTSPGRSPERDLQSGQLYFGYIDKDSVVHRVWYSDAATIKYWMDVINQDGENDFTIFRAGGTL